MPDVNSIRRALPVKAELRGEISPKQPTWLTEAVAVSVHAQRGQVKAIAAATGEREAAIYRAADINDATPLKAWWIPAICLETGSFTILDVLEAQVGRCAFQLPKATAENADVATAAGRAAREFGDVLADVGGALMDGTITRAEAATVEKQIAEMHVALAALSAVLARKAVAA